jgi:hypothetical protein
MMAEIDDLINQSTKAEPKRAPKLHKKEDKKLSKAKIQEQSTEIVEKALDYAENRVSSHISKFPSKVVAEAFRNFEEAAGSKKGLLRTLQFVPEANIGFKLVQKLLRDEQFINDPAVHALYGACRRHGLGLATLVMAFKDAKTAEISLGSLVQLAESAPLVLEQVAEDAQNRYTECTVCEGAARVKRIGDAGEWMLDEHGDPVTQLCYNCRGTGKTFKAHDSQSRKQFLQITGILDEKRLSTNVNINTGTQQVAMIKADFLPGDGSFEKLIKAIDTVTGSRLISDGNENVIDVPEVIVYEEKPNPSA